MDQSKAAAKVLTHALLGPPQKFGGTRHDLRSHAGILDAEGVASVMTSGDGRTPSWTATPDPPGLPGRDVTAAVRTGKPAPAAA